MSHDRYDRDWGHGKDFGKFFDPANFSFARTFRRHGGMKYYVLWLLSQRPMRGSEIIEEVQKQTMGWWTPSPGTIYPLLSTLLNDGFITRLDDLRYELADKGAEEIGLKREKKQQGGQDVWNTERILMEMEGYVSYLEEEKDQLGDFQPRISEIIERLNRLKRD